MSSCLVDRQHSSILEPRRSIRHQWIVGGFPVDSDASSPFPLGRIDSRFDAYKAPLFSDQTLHLDRSLLEPEAARLLNKTLKGFLALVSNYILLPVTLKALEWLVRRFQIHQVNVDDLMGCALPFHETSVFVKIGQVCALEGSKWTFLLAPILQGYPVSRDVIVNRAAKDLGFLELIWERARVLGAPSIGCKTYAAFYSAVTVETIHTLTLSYTQQVRREGGG